MSDLITLPPNELITEYMLSADQLAESRDWGHTPLQLEDCQKLAQGEGIRIALLDTGCDLDHSDLHDRIILAKDFSRSRTGPSDVAGHGTHCAGIIAATNDGNGMIGAAPKASLLIGKVLGDTGSGSSLGIAEGIRWAIENGANIISMSLGGPNRDSGTAQAIADAVAQGIFVVVAFGNEGPQDNTGGEPGKDPNCFGVAAVDSGLRVANFSSRGPEIDFSAPGVSIKSTYPGNRYAVLSGTSMATPYVSGCVALYLSYLKKLGRAFPKFAALYALIKSTAKDLDTPGFDNRAGWGLIQPLAMLNSVVTPPEPPVPPLPNKGRITLDVDWTTRRVDNVTVS